MEVAAFTIIWVGLALYALLAGADFGVGVWVLVSRFSDRGDELRRDALGYFGPVWEVNTLFLVFFMVGLMAAFPKVIGLLGRTLMPLVLIALAMFVVRSGAYALFHHGPERGRGPAMWLFAVASVAAGLGLGYAAVAPASGFMTEESLPAGFYTSAVALASLPLTLAAAAHLSALVIAAYADVRGTGTEGWYRGAALASGLAVFPLAVVFTIALASDVPYTAEQLAGPRLVPMVAGAVTIFLGTVALWRHRYGAAALLTFAGYFAGLIGGAFVQYPYMVYPLLEISEAAGPDPTLVAYLAVTAVGGPLLLAAMVALYHTTLGPGARRAAGT